MANSLHSSVQFAIKGDTGTQFKTGGIINDPNTDVNGIATPDDVVAGHKSGDVLVTVSVPQRSISASSASI